MKQLDLYNTQTRIKETFKPRPDKPVVIYACGITPYEYSHVGHARSAITFDVLIRVLQASGYQTTFIRNVTDVDDKILAKIPDHTGDITSKISGLVDPYIKDYRDNLAALGCNSPDHEPYVTKFIPHIIAIIETLIAKGHAYVVNNDVYYDVSTFDSYGRLSGRSIDEMLAGARIDVNEVKRNPADFALWKGNDSNLFWQSPWGYGRPGWHIECSAMSHHYAETLDIHGGGADLIFPHHENERAQSEAAYNVPITSIWIHNGMLNINKEKMSKSLGNIILLKEVTSRYSPQAFRFYLLQHGYRAPLNFSDQDFEAATKAYERLPLLGKDVDAVQTKEELFAYLNHSNRFDAFEAAHCALLDDLNTPQALGSIFGALGTIKQSKKLTLVCASFLYHLMGLSYQSNKSPSDLSDEIKELIEKRTTARQERDWKTADEIRDKLSQMGYDVQDKKL